MLLVLLIPAIFASDAGVDEPGKKLGTAAGTEKVDILNDLSRLTVYREPGIGPYTGRKGTS